MGLWTKGCLLWCQLSRLQTLSKLHRRRVDTWVCHGMITSILMSVQYIYIYIITFGLPLVFTSFSPYKDFVNIVKEKVQPVRKRELRVEMLEGSLDWKTHFHQLGIYISGLVSSRNPDRSLNHCWRFIRRADPFQWFKVVFKLQMHYDLILSVPR